MIERIYEDLSVYTNQLRPFQLVGVRNVGWIDVLQRECNVEIMAEELALKLLHFARGVNGFKPLVETERVFPVCPICGEIKIYKAERSFFAKSELWIPGKDVVYASPILILHNIQVHGYLPPRPYIEAIEDLREDLEFSGQDTFQYMLKGSAWKYSNRDIKFWKE